MVKFFCIMDLYDNDASDEEDANDDMLGMMDDL